MNALADWPRPAQSAREGTMLQRKSRRVRPEGSTGEREIASAGVALGEYYANAGPQWLVRACRRCTVYRLFLGSLKGNRLIPF